MLTALIVVAAAIVVVGAWSLAVYNNMVRNYNILVQSFPAVLLANMFGFGKKAFFELDDPQDALAPKVKL